MGVMHAIYGVGAMCSPLVTTQFARIKEWHLVYLAHIGLVALNGVLQALVFRFRSEEGEHRTVCFPSLVGSLSVIGTPALILLCDSVRALDGDRVPAGDRAGAGREDESV